LIGKNDLENNFPKTSGTNDEWDYLPSRFDVVSACDIIPPNNEFDRDDRDD